MGRHKKVTSDSKSPKCSSSKRIPSATGSGNAKENNKNKRKNVSIDVKNSGEAATGNGGVKSKVKTELSSDTSSPPPPASIEPPANTTSTSTSTRTITTPSRYSFPFLRSTVKKPARIQTPPPEPSQEKGKEKDKKAEQPKAERKRWEAWSNQDKNLFFEAVAEYGKDFESIQRYIGQRHKKLGYPPNQNKNKDQCRHLYYRTCHKLMKYVSPKPDQPRVDCELYALVNYGELRKKLKGGLTAKWGQKLDELVTKGSTSIRFKGRNLKVKTPVCKAIKKLKSRGKNEEKPTKLPARVLLELQPRSNAAWAEVQGVAHNPRLRLMVPLQKNMGNLLSFLSEKWTPHRLRLLHSLKPEDKSNFNQVMLHVPKGTTITPYKKLHGRFIHAGSKTPFTLVSEEMVASEESPNKSPQKNEQGAAEDVDITDRLLQPELDHNMDVDLLDNHHSEPMMNGNLPSMFGDGNSIGDLLTNMSNGSLTQTNSNLSFSNLSFSLSENANSLAPPSSSILTSPVAMETNNTASSAVGGAVDGSGKGDRVNDETEDSSSKETKMDVEEEEAEKELDELLKEGLTVVTASSMTATDIYLMMGQPEMMKFEYDFVKKEHQVFDVSTNHMMTKLVHLAKSSYVEVANPKEYVSVGVVTSPIRTNTPPSKSQAPCSGRSPSTNTRSPRGTATKGNSRGTNPSTSTKTQSKGNIECDDRKDGEDEGVHFAVPKAAAPIAVRRNQEPSHAQEGQQVLNQLEQMKRPPANFLLPRMKKRQRGVKPLVVQRTILPRPDNRADNMVSMAIINSSQANMGQFMPIKVSMSSLGTVVSPRSVQRPIRPNTSRVSTTTIAGVGKTITKTVLAPTKGAPKTVVRRIIPVNITNSPENRGNIPPSPVSFSPVNSPVLPSSPAPESQVNQVSTSQLCSSPSPSASSPQPLGSSTPARHSPLPMGSSTAPMRHSPLPVGSPLVGAADSSILNTTVILDRGPATPAQPINMESSMLNTPIVVEKTHQSVPGMDSDLLDDSALDETLTPASSLADSVNTSVVLPKDQSTPTTTQTTTPLMSAPEISALLDISMPASENGDSLPISVDSTTFKTFGQNISSISPNSTTNDLLTSSSSSTLSRDIGNVSPTSSPFKNSLGPEAQWFNGESLDISMSSLLGHLESPEKKDKTNPSTSTSTSAVPTLSLPPGLLSESSRDSIITRDVDTTLQVMLNENSIDYVAKFADLAAHISATPDTPHKISLIDKALADDGSPHKGNIIDKGLIEEGSPTKGTGPQLELPSST